ncbi:MAG: hypothetical protein OEV66_03590 [Spirochaetia bacterium]|nr:hypothetical protein [Spirochaetia bacterium]
MENKFSKFQPAFTSIIKTMFPQATIGVIITGLIAPFVVARITTGIENKKIQTELVTKILDMTKETDFNDERQLKRYSIYAQIVRDNPDLFNIKLDTTLEKANSLFSEISKKKAKLEMINSEIDHLISQKLDYAKKNLEINENLRSMVREAGKGEDESLQKEINENSDNIIKMDQEIRFLEAHRSSIEDEALTYKN